MRVLNSRLEVAYRAHAVLALLEVPVPLRRRQRHVGLEVEIVGAVAPWCTAVPQRAAREVVHRRQRGAAFVARRLSHQRVLAELGQRDRDRRYGQNGGPETVQIAQRAHQLSPVVYPRNEHHLRMKCDATFAEPAELRNHVRRFGVSEQPAAHDGIRRMHGDVERRQPVLHDALEIPLLEVGQRGEVAVPERQPIIVVTDIQHLPHALRVAVHEAEVAMIRAAADAGRLEHDAHR